jgi:hypothetical protein
MLATNLDTVATLMEASANAVHSKDSDAEAWQEEESALLEAIRLLTQIKIKFNTQAKSEHAEGRFSNEEARQFRRLNKTIKTQSAECYRRLDVIAAARNFDAEAFHKRGSAIV